MRFLQILFAFYILLLSLMPCTDASGMAHEESMNTEASSSDAHDESHEDTCTPLCSCNCCGSIIAIIFSERVDLIPVASFGNSKQAFFNQSASSLFNHSIWQPPKR